MPVAVLLTRWSGSYDLLHAALAIPLGLVLAVAALVTARSARRVEERTLGRVGGRRAARVGRALGILGLALAATAALAVGVYGLLEYTGRQS
jgi:hypothetical protein